jgi:hypothetical protein
MFMQMAAMVENFAAVDGIKTFFPTWPFMFR